MKGSNHQHLAMWPLLSILALGPSVIQTSSPLRSIASVQEESKHPRFDEMSAKVKIDAEAKLDLDLAKFKERRDTAVAKIKKDREEFKKESSDKKVIEEQKTLIQKNIIEVLVLESALKDLKEKKGIDEADQSESEKLLAEAKLIEESMIADLEAKDAPKEEPKKEVAKKEEPKKEEPKKEEVPTVKVTGPQEEKNCDADEKTKVLTAQVDDLMTQNQQILQAMMSMTNMMMAMLQQKQQQASSPFSQNGLAFNVSPYQYVQPMASGNWVYYPQGFQPQQPNIFAQPIYQQSQMQMQMGGIYPDQMHEQYQAPLPPQPQMAQPQWGLQPQMDFRYQPQFPQVGNFGNMGLSFNFSNT